MKRAVVVGGGILGTLHALFALRRGYEVVHLDRDLRPRGASVRNFGLIWVGGRRPGAELEFALRARQLWQEIGAHVTGIGFRANGSLTIAQHESELRVFEQVVARADAPERDLILLGAADVREVNPAVCGEVLGALHCRSDAAVEPRRTPDALRAAMLLDEAYTWLAGRHVVAIDDGAVRDHMGRRHAGDVVFVCPGAASGFDGWQPEGRPLKRVRLQMLETEPFHLPVTTSLADGDSLRYYPVFDVPARAELPPAEPLVAEKRIQLLLQQRLDGSLTIGDTHEVDEPFDVAVDEAPYLHLQARAESILGVPLPPVRRRWAGVYSQVDDDRVYYRECIGTSTWVVTGAGGRGMTLGPAIAEDVLAAVEGAAVTAV